MLLVKIPPVCVNEQHYILDIMLGEFLGLPFRVEEYDKPDIKIIKTDGSSCLTLNADFFHQAHSGWLKSSSMPELPVKFWHPGQLGLDDKLVDSSVPVLYGQPGIDEEQEGLHLKIDLFGSSFFMLSRYEEVITQIRDVHERFPASASIAYKAGFLDRPVVNEYLEIFWACIRTLWPELSRRKRNYRRLISCDVDHPYDLVGYSIKRTLRRVVARLARDKNPKLALFDGLNYIFKKFGSDHFDEYRNNIDWIMAVNQEAGNRVAFYFIPEQTNLKYDNANEIRTGKISRLLSHIVDSGHEVGFHPGYDTYVCPERFRQSAEALYEVCTRQNIDTSSLGGRQHYLRYDISKTPMLWQENGFIYDSTLGYADMPGFRAGVCYEYSMYSLPDREKMNLKQRPLIIMEGQIISKQLEGLGFGNDAMSRFEYFKSVCQKYSGDFTLLWHNSFFSDKNSKSFYASLIYT